MKGNEQLQSTSGSTSRPLPVHFWPALSPHLYPTDFYLYVDMVHLLCRFSTNIVYFEKLRNYPNLTKKILNFQDYDDFDVANEDDTLEEFLGIPRKNPPVDPNAETKTEGEATDKPAVNGETPMDTSGDKA